MNIKTIKQNVFHFLESQSNRYNIIFADPPYDLEKTSLLPELIFNKKLLKEDGIFILEHSKNINFEKTLNFIEQRTYSSVNFTFFKNNVDSK